jgi:hypothetical protein
MEYRGNREHLDDWVERRSDAQIEEYRSEKNVTSIDGLPALDV